jgi:hypothetical protein
MGKLHKKVVRILTEHFGDVTDALDEVDDTGWLTGVIISKAFNKLAHKKRQELLWQALEDGLTPTEQSHVGPIATLTPAEAHLKTV